MEVVRKMEKYGSKSGKTSKVIRIIECGEIDEALEKDEDDGDVRRRRSRWTSPSRENGRSVSGGEGE